MNTIFKIVDPTDPEVSDVREVEGVGQATCTAVLKSFKGFKIILKGFINSQREFIPVKLK